jgi:tryptophan-rich sensory protein
MVRYVTYVIWRDGRAVVAAVTVGMSAQLDWVAAIAFIGFPVYHLLTSRAFSRRDDVFYRHLEAHSSIFPRSDSIFRGVFGLAWAVLFPSMGVAGFLFWRDADVSSTGMFLFRALMTRLTD